MSDPLEKIKPSVRAISPYGLKPLMSSIKINQNENPFDMPEEIKREVARRLAGRPWSRYPDFAPSSLIEKLAALAGWRPDGILVGNGSNELIMAALAVMVGPGTRVVIPEPTFALYKQVVAVLGGQCVTVGLTPRLEFDVGAIAEAARGADLVIICSPNNPTGCRLPDEGLIELARGFDGILIVDEAYHEFSGRTVVPLLEELPNLVVLRTFSKAMAMAGLRVGYLLARAELAREIDKARLPYNLNFFSATAAEVACERYDLLRPQIELIISERERLLGAIAHIDGICAIPSAANFFLVKARLGPRRLFEELLARDILVRDVSNYPMLSEYLRISVGAPPENDSLIAALQQIMASSK
jgi:histidinol-phosphate aminotransferase